MMDMEEVADIMAESWDEIQSFTIQKSWRNIIASSVQQPDREILSEKPSSHGGIGVTSNEGREDLEKEASEYQGDVDIFQELGYSVNEDEISTWFNSDRKFPDHVR